MSLSTCVSSLHLQRKVWNYPPKTINCCFFFLYHGVLRILLVPIISRCQRKVNIGICYLLNEHVFIYFRKQMSWSCACLLLCGIPGGLFPAGLIKPTLAGPNFHFRNHWVACLRPWWGLSEQATHCIPIIHFGIAVQNGLLFRFLLSALVGLHSQTLSQAGIISWLSKICASDIFSFLSECFIDSVGISHASSLKFKEVKMTQRASLSFFPPPTNLG